MNLLFLNTVYNKMKKSSLDGKEDKSLKTCGYMKISHSKDKYCDRDCDECELSWGSKKISIFHL